MLTRTVFALLMLIPGLSLLAQTGRAESPNTASRELVQYQLDQWKTTHADGKHADQLVSTLKKLRCEVKVHSHGEHTDVNYRCEKWQTLSLKSHSEAHQWENWLKKYGFQTKHVH